MIHPILFIFKVICIPGFAAGRESILQGRNRSRSAGLSFMGRPVLRRRRPAGLGPP